MSAGRIFLVSLLAAMVCVALFYVLVPDLMVRDPKAFDARIEGYGPGAVESYLAWLDTRDLRPDYLGVYRWIDTVFPLAIFGLLSSAIWGLWARPAPMIARLGVLVCATYLAVDYWENAAVAALLRSATSPAPDLVAQASLLTQFKWGALIVAALLCVLGLALTLIKGGRG